MSNLEEFLNNKLPEDQDDLFMEKITKLRMERKRKDYEQKLRKSYDVSKERYQSKKIRKIVLIGLLISMIIALGYLLFATNVFLQHQQNDSNIIASYIEDNKIHNYDITRGDASDNAYNEYQLGNYVEAINSWKSVEMNLQDSFYLSMSNFYVGNYNEAEINFRALNKMIGVGDKFYPELQLYRALNFQLLNEDGKAKEIYESWPNDSWMSREYNKIMND